MKAKCFLIKSTLWVVVISALGTVCVGQSYWTRSYGQGFIFGIHPTSDGNFLLAGQMQNSGRLIKINPDGDTLWMRTYGESNSSFISLLPTSDGNFIVAGQNASRGRLIKVKPEGDTLWTKTFQDSNSYFSTAMFAVSDGTFLFAGGADGKAWVVKITSDGDTLWTRKYGSSSSSFTSIHETPAGEFFLVGREQNNAWVLKIKPDGDTLWSKTYADTISAIQWILPIADDQFLLAGFLGGNGWLLKIGANGDTLWTKSYENGYSYFNSVLPTPDGNFIIAGQQSDQMYSRPLVMKINSAGDTIWTQTYRENSTTMLFVAAREGVFYLSGITTGGPDQSCWLMSIIDNQYAYENKPFTFAIPAISTDSLNYVYTPLNAPPDMMLSTGGTLTWMPKTDSAYQEDVEYLVSNSAGRQDTLTFAIYVNPGSLVPITSGDTFSGRKKSVNQSGSITTSCVTIKISLPSVVSSVCIYDINGRIVDRIKPIISGRDAYAIWSGTNQAGGRVPCGSYFARVTNGKNSQVWPFLFVR